MTELFEKVGAAALKVTKTVQTVDTRQYDVPFLLKQRLAVMRQRDLFVDARNRELVEIESLIRAAAGLGISEAVAWVKANPLPVIKDEEPIGGAVKEP